MTTNIQPAAAKPLWDAPTLPHGKLPANVNPEAVAQTYLDKLSCLTIDDLHDAVAWRDILAFTNTFRTFNQRDHVFATWNHLSSKQKPTNFKLKPGSVRALQPGPAALLTARFTFETTGELVAKSTGLFILVPAEDSGGWKFWILNTLLGIADTLGNPDVLDKVAEPVSNGPVSDGSGSNRSNENVVDVVIVGAGQNGLCMLGRLKALGLTAVALEKNEGVGDNWTNRYDSAKLHLNKWYANMPFGNTFNDDSYPYFLTAADLSRGFQKYVKDYGLDVRTSTVVNSATWNEDARIWTVSATQQGSEFSIKGRHLIFAIGSDQVPNFPSYPNREAFNGTVLHSVDYKSPKPWKGLKGVVVGTANTAHDVAEDMVEENLSSVTMVQRSPTIVMPFEFVAHNHDKEYNADADLYESDQAQWGLPLLFYDTLPRFAFAAYSSQNSERFEALEKRGFKVTKAPNLLKEIRERSGGHYLDVGCSQKIIDGLVKIKGGEIESYTPTGLKFTDGTTLDADVIVWATGFKTNIRDAITKIVGPKIGALLEAYPEWNEEGEQPGFFRPQKQPAIWYAIGELAMARLHSRFLAFFIKADIAGVPFEPYLNTP